MLLSICFYVPGVKVTENSTEPLYEDQAYLQSQSGTTLLDKFTHCLLVKCSAEVCLKLKQILCSK